ncbi:MAG: hypothetical protein ACLQG3_14160 [Terracidiphilus sp.]
MLRLSKTLLFALAWSSLAVHGQQAGETLDFAQPSDKFPAAWYPQSDNIAPEWEPAPVRDLPFVASVSKTGWIIGDPTRAMTVTEERDSQGRERSETPLGGPFGAGSKTVSINDPVSHCGITWVEVPDPAGRRAQVYCGYMRMRVVAQPLDFANLCSPWQYVAAATCVKLGPASAAGLSIVGLKLHDGTQSPVQDIERWYSPELVLQMKDFVHQGEETKFSEVIELKRQEPDKSDFYPPPGMPIDLCFTTGTHTSENRTCKRWL